MPECLFLHFWQKPLSVCTHLTRPKERRQITPRGDRAAPKYSQLSGSEPRNPFPTGDNLAPSMRTLAKHTDLMDEKRIQDYLSLIQQISVGSEGEQGELLQSKAELVDEGLLLTMATVASQMQATGEEQAATQLLKLAEELAQMLAEIAVPVESGQPSPQNGQSTNGRNSENHNQSTRDRNSASKRLDVDPWLLSEKSSSDAPPISTESQRDRPNEDLLHYRTFLQQLLEAEVEGGTEAVSALLTANLEKLDQNFADALPVFATQIIAEQAEAAKLMVALLENISIRISKFPLGNIANNKDIAIVGYQVVLQHREAHTELWGRTQNHLGIAYSERLRGERADNIERAISAYEQALSVYKPDNVSIDWAAIQHNLGTAYKNRVWGERAENIERAISAYEKALAVYTRDNFASDWATIQHYLGTAYNNRVRGNRAENIERAISAYEQALTVYAPESFPIDWAAIQTNLGNAYKNRVRGERTENVERAISAYERALTIYTPENFPIDWAKLQANLGTVYKDRVRGEKDENIERAIFAYEQALTAYKPHNFPGDWAAIQHHLGQVYSQRLRGERAENIERAIASYQQALTAYTSDDFPLDWAAAQHDLGTAYQNRVRGDKIENIERAIVAYEQALTVYTPRDYPANWAAIQNDLGLVYGQRLRGEKAENIECAIAAYEQALAVYSPQYFPLECLRAARGLANLGFSQGNWFLANLGYSTAIEAMAQSRAWAAGDQHRQKVIAEAISGGRC
ncbi:MAG: tetratricopeptide repeat protein [Cyanobacteriota bacterium]|nr:tetratricopeptide repeat protein [Cyanobacteriota bacterium]